MTLQLDGSHTIVLTCEKGLGFDGKGLAVLLQELHFSGVVDTVEVIVTPHVNKDWAERRATALEADASLMQTDAAHIRELLT